MIKLYHAPFTRSIRILWLLEELGVPYQLERVAFQPPKLPFSQPTPYGKVPAIEDGDVVMFESGAILEYILERYGNGKLAPAPGSPERGAFLQWVHFAEATAYPPIGTIVWHTFYQPEAERIPAVVTDARARLDRALEVVEKELAGRDYLLASGFSAADVMLGVSLLIMRRLQSLDPKFTKLAGYLARLEKRPALQKALA